VTLEGAEIPNSRLGPNEGMPNCDELTAVQQVDVIFAPDVDPVEFPELVETPVEETAAVECINHQLCERLPKALCEVSQYKLGKM